MNRAHRCAMALIGVGALLTGCVSDGKFAAGEASVGMQMREVTGTPLSDVSGQRVTDSAGGPVDTVSAQTVERQRQEVYDSLGSVQVELADDYVAYAAQQETPDAGADTVKQEFAAWGELSPDEVAVLPAEYQFYIPDIGCDQLNSRTVISESAASEMFTACQPDHSESGSYVKHLMNEVRLTSEHVASASLQHDQASAGNWLVDVKFTSAGAKEWSSLAGDAVNHQVAILVNNVLVSAPTVQAGAEASGNVFITGDFTKDEARELLRHIISV